MNDPWSAPNYTLPVATVTSSVSPQGMRWDTTANNDKYITASGSRIQCTIGLGSAETVVATLLPLLVRAATSLTSFYLYFMYSVAPCGELFYFSCSSLPQE
jgi:hypothetical protein